MEGIARYDKINGTASQCNNIQGKQPDLCSSVMPTNTETTKEDHERMSSEVGTNALLKQTKEHSICGTSFILQDAIVSFFTSTFAFRLFFRKVSLRAIARALVPDTTPHLPLLS